MAFSSLVRRAWAGCGAQKQAIRKLKTEIRIPISGFRPLTFDLEILRNGDGVIVRTVVDETDVIRLAGGRRDRRGGAAGPAHGAGPGHGARSGRVLLDGQHVSAARRRARE